MNYWGFPFFTENENNCKEREREKMTQLIQNTHEKYQIKPKC